MDRKNNLVTRLLNRLGPGLITGASDDDPSGIGTYTQAGAALSLIAPFRAHARIAVEAESERTVVRYGNIMFSEVIWE